MRFNAALLATSLLAGSVFAHPELLTEESAKHEPVTRSTNKCAAAIEARKAAMMEKRTQRLFERRMAAGSFNTRRGMEYSEMVKRNKYTTIQNDTCVLAPETVWGPYAVDGEIQRHDLRETQEGIDFYFDIGIIDTETCEPLPNAALTIWNCNATGYYASFTGIDPDSAELSDGWTKRTDGTTDDETFLRGIQVTDSEGIVEFLTKFPGYYVSRTTHIHLTVQANISNGTSYSESSVQHLGQLFFEEDLLAQVYATAPYSAHLSTLNRTTNSEDSLFKSANSGGSSAIVSVELLGDTIEDGLVGYITVGVNSSAAAALTTGGSVNPQGWLPTVSVAESKLAAATAADIAAGYTSTANSGSSSSSATEKSTADSC